MSPDTIALILTAAGLMLSFVGMIGWVLSYVGKLRTELKGDIGELRAELKGDISGLRSEFSELRGEVHELRQDLGAVKISVARLEGSVRPYPTLTR